MTIQRSFQIEEVNVYPEHNGQQNVIRRVIVRVTFSKDGAESVGIIESVLNVSDLSNFVPIEQLTDQQIIDWAINAQGGEALLSNLEAVHQEELSYRATFAGTVKYVRP